jgi:hypothetical protein
VESVAHPPELGGGVAGPAFVGRDDEIDTAAGHIGNLGGAPRAVVEFRSGGAAVDVGPDQLGVAARAIVLAGDLLNSFVRNSKSRRERLFSRDTNKNANKSDSCGELLRVFSTRHEIFLENMESNQRSKLLLLLLFSICLVPLAGIEPMKERCVILALTSRRHLNANRLLGKIL